MTDWSVSNIIWILGKGKKKEMSAKNEYNIEKKVSKTVQKPDRFNLTE